MKRIIFCIVLALLCSSASASLTYDGTYLLEHFQEAGTPSSNNPLYLSIEEIESDLASVVAGTADTLDVTYDAGSAITVDDGAVTLTTSAASDSAALAIVHGETGNYSGFTLTNASAYPGIQITTSGAGADITGTSATWSISKAGAITGASLATTGAVTVSGTLTSSDDAVLSGTAYDIQWDSSENTLEVLDNSYVAFGTGDDVTMQFDATNFEVFAAAADTPFDVGGTSAGFDIDYFFETAGKFRTDYDGDFINLTDDMDLRFGTGASADGDFQISSNSSNVLTIGQIVSGTGTIAIGVDNKGIDTTFYGDATGDYVKWDESEDELFFEDAVLVLNEGSTLVFEDSGGAADWTVKCSTGEKLEFIPAETTDDQVVAIGDADHTSDLLWYTKTASSIINIDASTDLMYVDGVDIRINDSDILNFGDGSDVSVTWNGTNLLVESLAEDTGEIEVGATNAIDLVLHANTAASEVAFNANTATAEFDGYDIQMMDDDIIAFGDSDEITIQYDEDGDNDLQITGDVSIEGTTPLLTVGDAGDEDAVLYINGHTNGYYVGSDTTDDKLNIGVGDTPGTTCAIEIDSSANTTITGGLIQAPVVVTDAAEYDVLAANSGKIHIITDLGQNTSIDLPAEAAGLNYEFWYCGGAEEAHDHTIDSENDTNYFIGGVMHHDNDDGAVAAIPSDGDSNSKFTINDARDGTIVKVTCDGTNWYITGSVNSDTAPAFADQ